MAHNEADICRIFITPALVKAGWDAPPYSFTEQKTIKNGRIVVQNQHAQRRVKADRICELPSKRVGKNL
jgi:type I site-specific restriction endonuclease